MAKIQGVLPIYDPLRKTILGSYLLPFAKTFVGSETQFNINKPAADGPSNLVPVQKISPNYQNNQPVDADHVEIDWFMAAVFTDAQIRSGYYRNFPNYQFITDQQPVASWVSPASHSMGQLRAYKGPLIVGLEGSFQTGAVNELAPTNSVAPVVTGTGTVGQILSTTNGTWAAAGSIVYTYQWFRAGVLITGATAATYLLVAGDSGKTVTCNVTATYTDANPFSYPNTVASNGIAVA